LRKTITSVVRYVLTLALAFALLWWLFKDIDLDDFMSRLKKVEYGWVYLSIGISFFGYWVRAYRWNLLFKSLDVSVSTFRLFLAVMVGYLANMAFPRMGEVSRCAILRRTDNIPMSTSIGTVVTERGVDLISLLSVLAGAMLVEFGKISSLLGDMMRRLWSGLSVSQLTITIGIIAAVVVLIYWLIKRFQKMPAFAKLKEFLVNLGHGIGSITKLKSPTLFILSTVAMWLSYFFMSYVIVFSMEETAWLDLKAGLVLLAMGGIGMAMPVQGGIGTYHAFVAGILLWYGIGEQTGVFFATLLHTSQVVTILVLGGVSILVAVLLPVKNQIENSVENQRSEGGQ
tara:strand:+ start:2379 stop:3404 length:1026 start_codon:yes stop_codon:yes gene_type:complete